jgi:hypothetical protein
VGTRGEVIETIGMVLGLTMLSSLILAVLLINGGIEDSYPCVSTYFHSLQTINMACRF